MPEAFSESPWPNKLLWSGERRPRANREEGLFVEQTKLNVSRWWGEWATGCVTASQGSDELILQLYLRSVCCSAGDWLKLQTPRRTFSIQFKKKQTGFLCHVFKQMLVPVWLHFMLSRCSSLWLWCPLLCFRLLSWHTCWICGHGLALLSVNVRKYVCFHTYSLFWSESVCKLLAFPVILFVSTQRKIQTPHKPKRFTTNQETKWECSVCLIRQMCLGQEQQK